MNSNRLRKTTELLMFMRTESMREYKAYSSLGLSMMTVKYLNCVYMKHKCKWFTDYGVLSACFCVCLCACVCACMCLI